MSRDDGDLVSSRRSVFYYSDFLDNDLPLQEHLPEHGRAGYTNTC
jgi:hypothetical protein